MLPNQSAVQSRLHAFAIFGAFALAYWLSYALRAVNAVLGVPLQTELGVSSAQLGLLSSMFFVFCLHAIAARHVVRPLWPTPH